LSAARIEYRRLFAVQPELRGSRQRFSPATIGVSVMDEDDRPVERETTVIHTDGGRGGGGGAIAAILVILVIAVLAFLFFGGYLQRAAEQTDINVNVAAPKIDLPDIKIETPPAQPQQQPADANKQ
jgi:hypothetical protein